MSSTVHRSIPRRLAAPLLALLLAACATPSEPPPSNRKEVIHVVTAAGELQRFNAGRPQQPLAKLPLRGLPPGERLFGIDFRVSRGVLFALSSVGRLYTIDTRSGQLTPIGTTSIALPLEGERFGFDFNPVADRIRVVSDKGQSLRLHPETGAAIDGDAAVDGPQPDPVLHFAPGDAHVGRLPQVVAAAYTYNKRDDKLTTNYALDAGIGALLIQGSREGAVPVVSPNTGRLTTVGSLGVGALQDAAFDIADIDNSALAALRIGERTRLYAIDLASGRATLLGTLGDGQPVWGMAIEP
ncbi:DUF4394 domain-containing protein [Aquincola sp. S2]|uniref:DUF4394 domain-containing protein n=1 Tax=Pseudaquabacterium terrae TaxID=2732868 RepID=A0ABX2EBN2_9BURK|nr:DUF4394 domain-containing protein [Aquabacterium terrae]NRF66323.1 DUF4394 domain-containing protein [Aquabacterium terrae]